jgi:rubrerythrin
MNVYEYAMKVEKDGERYYRELAEKSPDEGLKAILNMLADEEVKHYVVFERMNNEKIIPTQPHVDIFKHTQNIFQKLQKNNASPSFTQDQIEMYKRAFRLEENSYKFYTEKALMMEEGEQKKAFLRIAEEERQHMLLLENLVDYVSAPVQWIESAEFNNLSAKSVQGQKDY